MRQLVSAPSLRKAVNGLVEVGNRIDVGDQHWEDGVAFTPLGCQAIFGHVPFCPAEDKSPFYDCPAPVQATAYLLEVGLAWSLVDLGADPKAIIAEAFDVGTSHALERLASTGIADVAGGTALTLPTKVGTVTTGGIVGRVMGTAQAPPTLAGTALDVGGSSTSPAQAIGAVETKMVDAGDHTGGGGTLLMSPLAAAQAGVGQALQRDDGHLVTTATGSKVVVGNIAPAKTIYGVIGDVDVYLGEILVLEAYERSKNEWVGRAERRAIAVWNTCGVYSASFT